jgi:hypothetical protein
MLLISFFELLPEASLETGTHYDPLRRRRDQQSDRRDEHD